MITRRLFLASACAFAALPVGAQTLGLSGQYQIDGRNPDGSRYSGIARIVQIGDRVNMTWDVAGTTYEGRGVIEGNTLTVDWGAETPVIYDISDPYQLIGVWAGGKASEILTSIP